MTDNENNSVASTEETEPTLYGLDDWLYPDNKNRYARAAQLSEDICSLGATLSTQKDLINSALKRCNETIEAAYRPYIPEGIGTDKVNINPSGVEEVTLWVSKLISPVVATKYAAQALESVAVCYLRNAGRIGEAALTKLVGLPNWFKVGKWAGSAAVGALVEFAVAGVEGALQRTRLREAIHTMRQPRITLKQHLLVSSEVLTTVQAVSASFNAIKGVVDDKNKLDEIAQNLVKQNKIKADSFTPEAAEKNLAEYDKLRNSWTDEDRG